MKIITIDQLALGMYVESIPDHPKLSMVQKGYIKDPSTLGMLRNLGVERIVIDPSKSKRAPTVSKPQPVAAKTPAKDSLKSELPKAKKLLTQAKQLQSRLMSDVKLGQQLDLQPVNIMADEFIGSVFRNQSALACLRLIKDKDDYLLEHSLGVTILMTLFARALGISGTTLHQLCVGSLLHDIGKIRIPEAILNKPGKLTPEEFEVMKTHAEHSRQIISSTPGISKVSLDVAAMHHEKLDGTGYPQGLKGEQITMAGRMVAICDIYDAMTADRVYHKGMAPTLALKRLLGMTPNGLDKNLVVKFIQCLGVYPNGCMVELSSGRVGIVMETENRKPTKPLVKVVYNLKTQTHIMPNEIELERYNDHILKAIDPRDHKLELTNYL
ncbi:HD-GYP domain-containing protein [Ferrimonas sp. SCSIO 43195]|uniref:HD-GYP domain-containing protein n=1 Tax=Ferrimonas sp. SCSIO 43195 TaxID=2822844 RepID=UPI002074BDEA|nr:HD-GYP domain-containing protein [Ferrimonas sp. SCSIO 43195]USD37567.1 HD-GYP domain-containing protein [Ferrimonas sp. SCSIO 43195]